MTAFTNQILLLPKLHAATVIMKTSMMSLSFILVETDAHTLIYGIVSQKNMLNCHAMDVEKDRLCVKETTPQISLEPGSLQNRGPM